MKILGIDPGLQRTGFGCRPPLARLHIGCADVSVRPSPCFIERHWRGTP